MWNIIYPEIFRLLASEDKKEQLDIARGLVKKALLKFHFDWTSLGFTM
jgi:hypothetical protein